MPKQDKELNRKGECICTDLMGTDPECPKCNQDCINFLKPETEVEGWEKSFDEKFVYESQGCSECGGFELVDTGEVRYPKGKYHCEYDLEKIKTFISTLLKEARARERGETLRAVLKKCEYWADSPKGYVDIIEHVKSLLEDSSNEDK